MSEVKPAFLLSLPRSGSTLLQRLLGAHSQIATVAEPWLLLPPLYALRGQGVYSEYGHRTAVKAIEGMISHLPRGRDDYLDAVSEMAGQVYGKLSPPGTEVFLDKTPRYGLVVDELIATFPDSPFIVLHRNPLAVIASITATFTNGRWKPYHHKQDLYLLSSRLLSALQRHPSMFASVRYEDLLAAPEKTLRRVIERLGLRWEPGVLDSFTDVSVTGNVGDPTGVQQYSYMSTAPLTKWHDELASPVRRAWSKRYLRWLGEERLTLMGYRLDELIGELDALDPDYSKMPADLWNTAKGALWSAIETQALRDKVGMLPAWRELFTHT